MLQVRKLRPRSRMAQRSGPGLEHGWSSKSTWPAPFRLPPSATRVSAWGAAPNTTNDPKSEGLISKSLLDFTVVNEEGVQPKLYNNNVLS